MWGGSVGSLGGSGGVLAEGSGSFVTFGSAAAQSQFGLDVDFRFTATICDTFRFLEIRPGAAHFFFEISAVFCLPASKAHEKYKQTLVLFVRFASNRKNHEFHHVCLPLKFSHVFFFIAMYHFREGTLKQRDKYKQDLAFFST